MHAHAPVLVAQATSPLSLVAAKRHLRVEHADDDATIQAYIDAATVHVARAVKSAIGTQTWQQDFDGFDQVMRLAVGPATSITSITYRNEAGTSTDAVVTTNYDLLSDALGPYVRFKDDYSLPTDLFEAAAVRITWVAGAAPEPLVAAIMLIVGDLYRNREAKVDGALVENQTVKNLMSTYRVF